MKSNSTIKIIVADDHQMMIDGLLSILSDDKTIDVKGIARNGKEVLDILKNHAVDLVLTDINMPLMNGIELTKIIREKYSTVKVLALSMFGDIDHIQDMLNAGVSGYILKNTGNKELLEAIHTIASGGTYYDNEVAAEMMRSLTQQSQKKATIEKVNLTDREIEIVKLIAKEMNNAGIGDVLSISERTVESHRKNIYRKTNTTNIVGLLKFAFANGFVEELK
jgi:two-component system, NarL family, nitrate/nitrite response regulator NarL